ncbi:MAG: 3-hydroxyisobutyrate dehydrogenase [Alphaproteobacteria bacterium]|nr:MAG: 3-hydroxyisobutyrate dehydrogenase [Alphaproteobacteria bacterium]
MTRIAFIGLGNMGLPMAKNLLKAGHDVVGFDLSDKQRAAFEEAGGRTAGSIAEAVREADVVITMLPAGEHVRTVYLGEDGVLAHAKEGALLIDSSTIDVETAREVAQQAAAKGHPMVDAPVSGGVAGAEAATLTFMVGGPDEAFAAARPILEKMGGRIIHAGGPGTGEAAKICNNMLLAISMIGTAEAFALARRLGLADDKFFEIASQSSGQCWSLTSYCPVPGPVPNAPSNRDYRPGFAAAMMLKDLRLAKETAESVGANTPLGHHAEELYAALADAGYGNLDFSAIFRRLNGEI